MGTDFPMLLGGSAQPLGCAVSFLDVVLRAVQGVHGSCEVTRVESLHDALIALDPMEAPWTRELLADCEGWTAYVNNGMSGGDSSAIAPALARHLDCRCVVAVNVQSYGPGHAATQLEILGPEGEPPLQYVRALSAHAEDGRWGWYESGEVQPFEDGDRYQRRRVRERLDRSLLVEYLDHLGIHVDDPEFFLTAVVIQPAGRLRASTRERSGVPSRERLELNSSNVVVASRSGIHVDATGWCRTSARDS